MRRLIILILPLALLAGCTGYGAFARSDEGLAARETGEAIGRAAAPIVAPLTGPAAGVTEEAIPYLAGLLTVLIGYGVRHWLSPNRAVISAIASTTRRET